MIVLFMIRFATMERERGFYSEAYPAGERPNVKAIFDALSDLSSADGCDPDWRAEVLEKADPQDVQRVRDAFLQGGTEPEIAFKLNIWPR